MSDKAPEFVKMVLQKPLELMRQGKTVILPKGTTIKVDVNDPYQTIRVSLDSTEGKEYFNKAFQLNDDKYSFNPTAGRISDGNTGEFLATKVTTPPSVQPPQTPVSQPPNAAPASPATAGSGTTQQTQVSTPPATQQPEIPDIPLTNHLRPGSLEINSGQSLRVFADEDGLPEIYRDKLPDAIRKGLEDGRYAWKLDKNKNVVIVDNIRGGEIAHMNVPGSSVSSPSTRGVVDQLRQDNRDLENFKNGTTDEATQKQLQARIDENNAHIANGGKAPSGESFELPPLTNQDRAATLKLGKTDVPIWIDKDGRRSFKDFDALPDNIKEGYRNGRYSWDDKGNLRDNKRGGTIGTVDKEALNRSIQETVTDLQSYNKDLETMLKGATDPNDIAAIKGMIADNKADIAAARNAGAGSFKQLKTSDKIMGLAALAGIGWSAYQIFKSGKVDGGSLFSLGISTLGLFTKTSDIFQSFGGEFAKHPNLYTALAVAGVIGMAYLISKKGKDEDQKFDDTQDPDKTPETNPPAPKTPIPKTIPAPWYKSIGAFTFTAGVAALSIGLNVTDDKIYDNRQLANDAEAKSFQNELSGIVMEKGANVGGLPGKAFVKVGDGVSVLDQTLYVTKNVGEDSGYTAHKRILNAGGYKFGGMELMPFYSIEPQTGAIIPNEKTNTALGTQTVMANIGNGHFATPRGAAVAVHTGSEQGYELNEYDPGAVR